MNTIPDTYVFSHTYYYSNNYPLLPFFLLFQSIYSGHSSSVLYYRSIDFRAEGKHQLITSFTDVEIESLGRT